MIAQVLDFPTPATPQELPLAALVPSPDNPRRELTPASLASLVASIQAQGVIQPLTVRPLPGDEARYEIVAGHRRHAAATLAGLQTVPVRVVEADDRQVEAMRIVENLQRAGLDPVEEATALARMRAQYGLTDEELGALIGKSGSWVSRTRMLVDLPPAVQDALRTRRLTAAHGWALLRYRPFPQLAERLAAIAQRDGLNAKLLDVPIPRAAELAQQGLIALLEQAPAGFDHTQCRQCPFGARFVDPTDDAPGYCAKPAHYRQLVVEARRRQHDSGAPLAPNAVQPAAPAAPGGQGARPPSPRQARRALMEPLQRCAKLVERLSPAEARDPDLVQLVQQVRAALDRVIGPAPTQEEE